MSTQPSPSDRLFLSVSVSGFDGDIDTLLNHLNDQISSDLETTLETELACRNVSIQSLRAPLYTQVSEHCPTCQTRLTLSEPTLDYENGATVNAYCHDCGWAGIGEYRLIDLLAYADEDSDDSLARFPSVSLVATGAVTPSYHTYPDSSAYDH